MLVFFSDHLYAKTDRKRAFWSLTWGQEFSRIYTFYIKLYHNLYFHSQQCRSNLIPKIPKKVIKPHFWLFWPFLPFRDFSKTIRLCHAELHIAPSNMFLAIPRKFSHQRPLRTGRPRIIGRLQPQPGVQ